MRECRHIARARRLRHSRSLDNLMEEVAGVAGEVELARRFGLDPSPIVRRDGAGPVDFRLPCGTTLDVKTSWRHDLTDLFPGGRLMVEHGKALADAYVFAIAEQGRDVSCRLVGWEWSSMIVLRYRPSWEGHPVAMYSHRVPVSRLQPIDLLAEHSAFLVAQQQKDDSMTALVETQRGFDGRVIVLRWWTDNTSVSVEVDGTRVGLAYATLKDGRRVWFDLFDGSHKPHPTPHKAIKAVLARASAPTPIKQAKQSSKQLSAASGWRQEGGGP